MPGSLAGCLLTGAPVLPGMQDVAADGAAAAAPPEQPKN